VGWFIIQHNNNKHVLAYLETVLRNKWRDSRAPIYRIYSQYWYEKGRSTVPSLLNLVNSTQLGVQRDEAKKPQNIDRFTVPESRTEEAPQILEET
jgi:hypothetical protein